MEVSIYEVLTLPISLEHIRALPRLPFVKNHKDPFDRLIAARAVVENLPLVTADRAFVDYPQIVCRWWVQRCISWLAAFRDPQSERLAELY